MEIEESLVRMEGLVSQDLQVVGAFKGQKVKMDLMVNLVLDLKAWKACQVHLADLVFLDRLETSVMQVKRGVLVSIVPRWMAKGVKQGREDQLAMLEPQASLVLMDYTEPRVLRARTAASALLHQMEKREKMETLDSPAYPVFQVHQGRWDLMDLKDLVESQDWKGFLDGKAFQAATVSLVYRA